MVGEERCCQKQQLWIRNALFKTWRRSLFGVNKPLPKQKNCRQHSTWLLNIPLYLPHPFIFLPSWHWQVQRQQWALITSKSYKCVVFIFEYLTLKSHTASNNASIYNCLPETIQSYIFLTSENQTTCFTKSIKPKCSKKSFLFMLLIIPMHQI